MSGITGVFNLDGRPVEPMLLERMTNALAHRGPDGIACWIDGPVGLAHLMLHTTPESLREKQPMRDEGSGLCLTLDGRVDNRGELRAALEAKGLALRTDTDAELVLRAYERWGEDCPQHIVGDFAFALWNARARTLFCARDPLGVRAFHYVFDGSAFSFSTELRPLLDLPGFRRRPNLGMLGEYLCDDIRSQSETLYQDILRLPPGHSLRLKDGALRLQRYYRVDPKKTIRYRTDAQYAEHFFDVFAEAVRCRLRSQTTVSQFVSGGLDSSSILGMTHHLIENAEFDAGRLAVYSLFSRHPEADERSYLNDLAEMWGDRVQSASMDDYAAEPLAEQAQRLLDLPEYPNNTMWQPLYELARRAGSRVTIWGFGGDEWLSGDRAHCADLLLRLKLPALMRQIRFDVDQSNIWGSRSFSVRDAVRWCLFPLVPHTLLSQFLRHVRSNVPRWINADFARSIGLKERLLRPAPPAFPTMAQRAIHAALLSGSDALSNEVQDRFDARFGMEPRYPYNDRRLIEFALAIPEEQRWRDDQPKFILRQAMRGLLPDAILQRRSKAEFSHPYSDSIVREATEDLFRSLRLAEHGYVDAATVRDMHGRSVRGELPAIGPMWMILAMENWYRMAFPAVAQPSTY